MYFFMEDTFVFHENPPATPTKQNLLRRKPSPRFLVWGRPDTARPDTAEEDAEHEGEDGEERGVVRPHRNGERDGGHLELHQHDDARAHCQLRAADHRRIGLQSLPGDTRLVTWTTLPVINCTVF